MDQDSLFQKHAIGPRSLKGDIVELFGLEPDYYASIPQNQRPTSCNFTYGCRKKSGVCSVTGPKGDAIVVCPNRFYADEFRSLKSCVEDAVGLVNWNPVSLGRPITGTTLETSNEKLQVSLIGKNFGSEVRVAAGHASLSFDWVAAIYSGPKRHRIIHHVIPIEVQAMDITGLLSDTLNDYRSGKGAVTPSEHGINPANVIKRQIFQLILKGKLIEQDESCSHGMYFIIQSEVYKSFERLIDHRCWGNTGDDEPRQGMLNVMAFDFGHAGIPEQRRTWIPRRINDKTGRAQPLYRAPIGDYGHRFIQSGTTKLASHDLVQRATLEKL